MKLLYTFLFLFLYACANFGRIFAMLATALETYLDKTFSTGGGKKFIAEK